LHGWIGEAIRRAKVCPRLKEWLSASNAKPSSEK
jgi:hypothetical protein